jgi:hypothetical protein
MPLIDYSEQIISVKHLVKDIEKLLINNQWDQASVAVVDAIADLRIMKANIQLLKENNGIPYDAPNQNLDPALPCKKS